ncbi:hypothetical protein XHV734_4294 [Xanthomonas hortorum pv. vitians]|nr:hypothetical protein XHV734_4294 [Xanthomonas hortorum pv. vitians]
MARFAAGEAVIKRLLATACSELGPVNTNGPSD